MATLAHAPDITPDLPPVSPLFPEPDAILAQAQVYTLMGFRPVDILCLGLPEESARAVAGSMAVLQASRP